MVASRDSDLPLRHTSMDTLSPGADSPTLADSWPASTMGLPFNFRITSPTWMPALSAALPGSTLATSAPFGPCILNELARDWSSVCTSTPRRAWVTLPFLTIWSLIWTAGIDGDGERHALIAARVGVDLRVDADHRAAGIEQRPARIAGIDGGIRLNERNVAVAGQGSALRADDAGGRGLLESERFADREHIVADVQLIGIAEVHRGQIVGIDFEHGDVAAAVRAQDLGLVFTMIGRA